MKRARKLQLVTTPVIPAPITRSEKLAAAITYLGERWALHPKFDKKRLRVGLLNTWRDSQPRYRP